MIRSRSAARRRRLAPPRRGASSPRPTAAQRDLHRDPRPAGAGEGRARLTHGQRTPQKARALAAAALGYRVEAPAVAFRCEGNHRSDAEDALRPRSTPTSREDKLWPEDGWRGLLAHFEQAGFVVLLGRSARERERSERLAHDAPNAIVPPRQSLPELAALARSAEDTGLTHLAAALGTSPSLVHRDRRRARRRGARALTRSRTPRRQSPRAKTTRRRRASDARAARRAGADAFPLHAPVVGRAAVAAAAAVVARPARARLSREDRRAVWTVRAVIGSAANVFWVHAVSLGETRAAAPARCAACQWNPSVTSSSRTATGREAGAACRRSRRAGVAAVRRAVRSAGVPRPLRAARGFAHGNRGLAESHGAVREGRRPALPRQRPLVGAILSRGYRKFARVTQPTCPLRWRV